MNHNYKRIAGMVLLIALCASVSYAQQQFTQTVTSTNRSCNSTCTVLDVADNTNPALIIFVTPVLVNGVNPNPIGAYWMYQNKWSIYNLNGIAMTVGAKFNVEYYAAPDANHFVYVVPQQVNANDPSYIDHVGLNNNPNAQIRTFPTSPPKGGALYNHYDVRVAYDASASKWLIANINNAPMASGAAYNVSFSGGAVGSNPVTLLPALNTATLVPLPTPTPAAGLQGTPYLPPATLAGSANSPPSGSAGGDLDGNYPNPKVIGLQGKPISSNPPTVGQLLRWNGTAWAPANESAASGNTYNAGTGLAIQGSTIYANSTAPMWNANQLSGHPVKNTTPTIGQVLRWNGTAWEPATETVTNAATTTSTSPIQTFFKKGTQTSPEIINTQFPMAELNHTILLTKRSRLIISATVLITAEVEFGVIATQGTQANFILVINGVQIEAVKASAGVGVSNTATICNFMIDKDPGTYTLEFIVANSQGSGSPKTQAVARYSSVMVIPQ